MKQDLSQFFKQMEQIANPKNPRKISSRVRFMIQDVAELRSKNWVPRREDSKPKTMGQIQQEAEYERLEANQLNNTPLNTPRKDDRNSDRKGGRSKDIFQLNY